MIHPWEQEYRRGTFLTFDTEPQHAVRTFVRLLKKRGPLGGTTLLDLGCGTGRNSIFLAEQGVIATGYDISPTAIRMAKAQTPADVSVQFEVRDIGTPYPLADQSIDTIFDITASHALQSEGRAVYLNEISRVLRPGGMMLLRTLAKDGDSNAKFLLKEYPGPEPDMYRMPTTGLIERVYTERELRSVYEPYFTIQTCKKTSGYTMIQGKRYKRNFFIAYLIRL